MTHTASIITRTTTSKTAAQTLTGKPSVLILHASGINRDGDAKAAVIEAGGEAKIVHLKMLQAQPEKLKTAHMLIVAGGFSYGDALGAGKRLGLELARLQGAVQEFVAAGKPVLGICNGFQVLVAMKLFGDIFESTAAGTPSYTLSHNASGTFACRWVYLAPNPASPCVFLRDIDQPIACPIAHGEGRFVASHTVKDAAIALRYCDAQGNVANGHYPENPNGSMQDIAALTNAQGNVLGLMPHPENYIYSWQHPQASAHAYANHAYANHTAGTQTHKSGLELFKAGIAYAKTFVSKQ